jgi:RimJ/RimL family protein N-acetyltransferase
MVLTDSHILLRPLEISDKFRLVEIANNKNISINLRDGFPNPYTLRNAEDFISKVIELNPNEVFAIEWNGEYVGNIGLHKGKDVYRKSAEIGYFLGESYWNKGIMTRAVKLVCEFGFRELDIIRIHAGIFEYNSSSMRVLEKCGFRREAVLKNAVMKNGRICDEYRYVKLLNE